MSIVRKWITKDGKQVIKTYSTVNGIDAHAYKLDNDRRYRQRKRNKGMSVPRKRSPTKRSRLASTLPPTTVKHIQQLHRHGASIRAIANQFGMTRYLVNEVLRLHA